MSYREQNRKRAREELRAGGSAANKWVERDRRGRQEGALKVFQCLIFK